MTGKLLRTPRCPIGALGVDQVCEIFATAQHVKEDGFGRYEQLWFGKNLRSDYIFVEMCVSYTGGRFYHEEVNGGERERGCRCRLSLLQQQQQQLEVRFLYTQKAKRSRQVTGPGPNKDALNSKSTAVEVTDVSLSRRTTSILACPRAFLQRNLGHGNMAVCGEVGRIGESNAHCMRM